MDTGFSSPQADQADASPACSTPPFDRGRQRDRRRSTVAFFVLLADRRVGFRLFSIGGRLIVIRQSHTTMHLPADTGRDRIPTGKGAIFRWKLISTFWLNEKP
ncbi:MULTISPECIES: hypothetical protein [Burkholderia]|uniref:hypothetical protein n=1 Tax=Burkholderia TaxID=32008 RepID=UPI000ABF20AD|nr:MULTISPECIES: hypothetical protein [Burkholderia]